MSRKTCRRSSRSVHGLLAEIDDPTSPQPSFPADVVGTYVVSLTVYDGLLDSAPANITVESISCVDAAVATLLDAIVFLLNPACPCLP
jgi:hypothetical protein